MDRSNLSPEHLTMLRDESAIAEDVIAARGYWTATTSTELADLGFAPSQRSAPALVIPVCPPDGSNGLYVIRPDAPRTFDRKDKPKLPDGTYQQDVLKYEQPKGASMRLDCPPVCRAQMGDPTVPLWLTEGQKKADSLASRDLCAIALLGVWNWRGKNDLGGLTALADWEDVALKGRDVHIVFDSDVMRKVGVQEALKRFTAWLKNRGAHVSVIYLPQGENGRKQGVDDFFAAGHTREELEALIEAPRPQPTPAPAQVELLDDEPQNMTRPLALIDGRAYAATWLHARVTQTEATNKQGEIVRLNPPVVTTERRLFVIRDDGRIFGDGAEASFEELALEVHLSEIPPADRLWSAVGVKAYKAQRRPDPVDVFGRVTDTVDRFIDFNKSLADQRTMAEMVGCYILATWFLDAFNVIGFLWPNGDRGSGKTQLLTVAAELGYLGQVILAGGSFASLRDLADYGALLCFDDAENLSDPRRTDPDKRALLLAGNRRGNTVPVKEVAGDRQWRTRYVNTFCARGFSATQLPDAILASRTIVVPLIRTPDRYRANADPLDYALWPHDRRTLLDDLWSLGLSRLPQLPRCEAEVNGLANLAGRSLEPWRAILAVAYWLDECGAVGLWDRMETLSVNYQTERPDLETGDITALVIRVLCDAWAKWANQTKWAMSNQDTTDDRFEVTANTVRKAALEIIEEDNLDIAGDEVTAQKIGKVLHKMRVYKPPRPGGKGPRKWQPTLPELQRWARAYGLPDPDVAGESEDAEPSEDIDRDISLSPGTLGTTGTLGTVQAAPVTESEDL